MDGIAIGGFFTAFMGKEDVGRNFFLKKTCQMILSSRHRCWFLGGGWDMETGPFSGCLGLVWLGWSLLDPFDVKYYVLREATT